MHGKNDAPEHWDASLREDSFEIVEASMWLDLIIDATMADLLSLSLEEKKRIFASLLVNYPVAIADLDTEYVLPGQLTKEEKLNKLVKRHQAADKVCTDFENLVRYIKKLHMMAIYKAKSAKDNNQ